MPHTHKRHHWLRRLNPFRAYNKAHRGAPGPIWLMTSTAPFQVPITIYLFIYGFIYLLAGLPVSPNTLTDTYPWQLVVAWAGSLLVGSGMSLLGRYLQKFRLESAGLSFVLASCAIYASTVIYISGLTGVFASGGFFAIAAGCIIRMIVIARSHVAERLVGQILLDRQGNEEVDPLEITTGDVDEKVAGETQEQGKIQ